MEFGKLFDTSKIEKSKLGQIYEKLLSCLRANDEKSWTRYHQYVIENEEEIQKWAANLNIDTNIFLLLSHELMGSIIAQEFNKTSNLILPSTISISEIDREIMSYIGGWAIRKMVNRYIKTHKWAELYCVKSMADDNITRENCRLIRALSRGGLSIPTPAAMTFFFTIEETFRKIATKKCASYQDFSVVLEEANHFEQFLNSTEKCDLESDRKRMIYLAMTKLIFKVLVHNFAKKWAQVPKNVHSLRKDLKKK